MGPLSSVLQFARFLDCSGRHASASRVDRSLARYAAGDPPADIAGHLKKTPYELFGGENDWRQGYRNFSKVHHPDTGGNQDVYQLGQIAKCAIENQNHGYYLMDLDNSGRPVPGSMPAGQKHSHQQTNNQTNPQTNQQVAVQAIVHKMLRLKMENAMMYRFELNKLRTENPVLWQSFLEAYDPAILYHKPTPRR